MKKLYLRNILVGISFILVLSSAIMSASGPGGGYANAPGESNCTSCHGGTIITSGNTNLTNIRLTSAFHGGGYVPDSVYNIELTFKQSGKVKFGFEVTVLDKSNNACGTLTATNTRVSKATSGSREYIQHTFTGTSTVATDSTRWVFRWKAPNSNVGKVSFWVVVMAANNNSTNDAGDIIYGKRFDIDPSPQLPKATAFTNDSVTCTNYTVTMSGSGTNSPTTYNWKFFPTSGTTPTTSTVQNPTVKFATSGTKMAILSVKNSLGVSAPDTFLINVNQSPVATILNTNPTNICKGDSVLVNANTGTGLTYLWLHNNKTTRSIYIKDPGTYNVKTTGTNGCSSTSINWVLNQYPEPSITISKGSTNDTVCESYNETFTATGTNVGVNDSILWYLDGILVKRVQGLTTTFSGISTAKITAVAKTVNGCKSVMSNDVNIIVRPMLKPTNFVTSKTTSTINISWKKTPGITGMQYSLNGINFNPTTTDSTLNLTSLQPNTTYNITVRSQQASPCNFSDDIFSIKTNACSNLAYVLDFTPRACKGTEMVATVRNLYGAKYSISFNNGTYSRDTVFKFTPAQPDSLTINIIDSLSPTCPPIVEKIGYQLDTLTDKDTGSAIKFTANLCESSYLYSIKPLYTSYSFYKNGVLVNSGANASFNYTGLVSGDKLTAVGKINTCEKVYGPVDIVVNTKPVSTYGFVRSWKTYTFTATDQTLSDYKWYVGSTLIGSGKVLVSDFTPYDNSTVDVKLVAKTTPGCTDSSTQSITVPKFSSIDAFQSASFQLYPNPFSGHITIESQEGHYDVQIVNGIGQNVYAQYQDQAGQLMVNSADWSAGVYHILIKDASNRISRFTFIKQ